MTFFKQIILTLLLCATGMTAWAFVFENGYINNITEENEVLLDKIKTDNSDIVETEGQELNMKTLSELEEYNTIPINKSGVAETEREKKAREKRQKQDLEHFYNQIQTNWAIGHPYNGHGLPGMPAGVSDEQMKQLERLDPKNEGVLSARELDLFIQGKLDVEKILHERKIEKEKKALKISGIIIGCSVIVLLILYLVKKHIVEITVKWKK